MKQWLDYDLGYYDEANISEVKPRKRKTNALRAFALGWAVMIGAGFYNGRAQVDHVPRTDDKRVVEISNLFDCIFDQTPHSDRLDSLDSGLKRYQVSDHSAVEFMQGTEYETCAYILDSGRPGPSVMIIGGIHGDEKGAYLAAEELCRTLDIYSGKVIVLPKANIPAIAKKKRFIKADMNRQFGINGIKGEDDKAAVDTPEYEMALAIKQFMIDYRINALLNLHEGSSKWANTLTYDNPLFKGFLSDVAEDLNKELPGKCRMRLKHENMPGTATYFAANELGILSFGIETAKSSAGSASLQTRIVRLSLERLGVISGCEEAAR